MRFVFIFEFLFYSLAHKNTDIRFSRQMKTERIINDRTPSAVRMLRLLERLWLLGRFADIEYRECPEDIM